MIHIRNLSIHKIISCLVIFYSSIVLAQVSQPILFGLTLNNHQIKWFHREQEAFIQFNENTFAGNEWGTGTENPDVFNPTNI